MKAIVLNLLVLFVVAALSSCATVTHGSSQVVTVSSNPSGATVTADGAGSSKTPTTLKLARKNDHVLVFNLEGYQQEQVTVLHVVSGAVAGNILLGGLIGWGVDAMTGAQYKLVPETVHVELNPPTLGYAKMLYATRCHILAYDEICSGGNQVENS